MEKKCKICAIEFKVDPKAIQQLYCTERCKRTARRKKEREKTNLEQNGYVTIQECIKDFDIDCIKKKTVGTVF